MNVIGVGFRSDGGSSDVRIIGKGYRVIEVCAPGGV